MADGVSEHAEQEPGRVSEYAELEPGGVTGYAEPELGGVAEERKPEPGFTPKEHTRTRRSRGKRRRPDRATAVGCRVLGGAFKRKEADPDKVTEEEQEELGVA